MVGITGLSHCSCCSTLQFNFSPSWPFQQAEFLSVSFCMQTRQNYCHLGLRKATLFLLTVQIYLLSWGTEKMLEGVVWLAGCPLWVCWHPQKSSITTNASVQVEEDSGETGKKGFVDFKRVVWHKAFYKIVKSIEKYTELGFVVMELGGRYIPSFSSFQLIMKNSTSSWPSSPGPPMNLIKYLSLLTTDAPLLLFVESTANFPVWYALFQVINLQTLLTNLHYKQRNWWRRYMTKHSFSIQPITNNFWRSMACAMLRWQLQFSNCVPHY